MKGFVEQKRFRIKKGCEAAGLYKKSFIILTESVLETKVLRKIFGPVRVNDDHRIRTNRELYELFNYMDVAKRINN